MSVLVYNITYNLSMAPPTHAGFNHGGHDFYVTFLPFPLTDEDVVDEVKLYITTPETIPVTFTISIPGMVTSTEPQ